MTRATLYKAHKKHTKETCLANFISATTFCMTLFKTPFKFYKATTVSLNYNFILTRVSTSGATKYFACQMLKLPVEICISTRRDIQMWYLHETWHVAFYT